jgi:glycosyltransferase involved in cell wall biosynthesis
MSSPAPKLLHIFSTFAPGGPQVRTVGLMAAFGDEFRHVVVPMDGATEARNLLPDGFPIEIEPKPSASGTLSMIRFLRALYKRVQPDLICTYNWGAIEAVMAARSMRLPVLHHEDGFLPDEAGGFKPRRVWTRRLLLRGARGLVVPSHTLENIARDTWRLPKKLVHWIPNGIHVPKVPEQAERIAARESFGLPSDDPTAVVIGGVGHLRREKNYARLIESFGKLKVTDSCTPYLLLLGDGTEREHLEKLADQDNIRERVVLAGHHKDLAPAYAAMDMFAISSDTEQMPIALLEAMAAQLPVVSTDVGDVMSMMPDAQSPFVVPIKNFHGDDATIRTLAQAIEQLMADGDLRTQLGESNRQRVEELFSYTPMLDSYRERYNAAL